MFGFTSAFMFIIIVVPFTVKPLSFSFIEVFHQFIRS